MDETEETVNYGLVGYPVLQTADIILYKADTVARRPGPASPPGVGPGRSSDASTTGSATPSPEPQAKLTKVPLIVGLDGQSKMSKSLDNHIDLASTPDETSRRVLIAFTDPQRTTRNIPGRPEVCNVYSLHCTFSDPPDTNTVYNECTSAARGCVDCKRHLAASVNTFLEPLRERRREFEQRPDYVKDVLNEGREAGPFHCPANPRRSLPKRWASAPTSDARP